MAEPARLGVFGSAFNPPHLAHLAFASEARWQLGLDRVILVPTGNPYHKAAAVDPGPEVRLALTEAAIEDTEGLEISDIEVLRSGPSYTCDTLEEIADLYGNSEIHLLMGADAAKGFGGWQRPGRILELARIGIAARPGTGRDEVEAVFESLDATGRIDFVEMPQMDISSSQIRKRIQDGTPFRHLVPTGVAQMIKNEDTYGIE